eukprot:TRINITY_DN719_c3_g1_i3.p3 TRINITY_DN719_c3_g1~~TRINITY_DN719_c3_g1_i3.p3  ORF type:complete len:112 (-),score=2.57 TRINITY_DN719_c3_g1_i3:1512-1847(-)
MVVKNFFRSQDDHYKALSDISSPMGAHEFDISNLVTTQKQSKCKYLHTKPLRINKSPNQACSLLVEESGLVQYIEIKLQQNEKFSQVDIYLSMEANCPFYNDFQRAVDCQT